MRVANCEGDPDHPINRGRLDPKSISGRQLSNVETRLTKPLYRAPGSDKWEEKSWDWTISEITKRIKKTRDATFKEKEGAVTVNRTEAIACLGGAANNNEDCYLLSKLMRSLGVVYLEHQARI
jgi:formate dehydrogenase major subunit